MNMFILKYISFLLLSFLSNFCASAEDLKLELVEKIKIKDRYKKCLVEFNVAYCLSKDSYKVLMVIKNFSDSDEFVEYSKIHDEANYQFAIDGKEIHPALPSQLDQTKTILPKIKIPAKGEIFMILNIEEWGFYEPILKSGKFSISSKLYASDKYHFTLLDSVDCE